MLAVLSFAVRPDTALIVERGILVARATSACPTPRASIRCGDICAEDSSAWGVLGIVLLDQSGQDLDQLALGTRQARTHQLFHVPRALRYAASLRMGRGS